MRPTSPSRHFPGSASAWTRRRVLRAAGAGALLPALLGREFLPLEALGQAAGGALDGAEGPILVVLQLGGGNDSLNTVVPYQGGESALYYDARPTLAIPPEQVLPLDGTPRYGLHPALVSMRELWARGEMTVVQGVGYPSPNLSHFSSMDYWHTAEPNGPVRDGWLGRFFQHRCAGDEVCGLNGLDVGGSGNLAFYGGAPAGRLGLGDPHDFGWRGGPFPGAEPEFENLVRRLSGLGGGASAFRRPRGAAFHYVRGAVQNAFRSADAVRQALDRAEAGGAAVFPRQAFPDSPLGGRFLDVAALIQGRLPASVYYVDQGGYDTHAGQVSPDAASLPLAGRHAELLAELDAALGAFAAEMKAQGHWQRILVLAFSEFGRKVPENGSLGTDHGAAQSVLLFGGAVRRGFHGVAPSLRPESRVKNQSLAFTTDFRRVYRTVLENWLRVPAAAVSAILPAPPGGSFDKVPFV